jgi:hypothetical protein
VNDGVDVRSYFGWTLVGALVLSRLAGIALALSPAEDSLADSLTRADGQLGVVRGIHPPIRSHVCGFRNEEAIPQTLLAQSYRGGWDKLEARNEASSCRWVGSRY